VVGEYSWVHHVGAVAWSREIRLVGRNLKTAGVHVTNLLRKLGVTNRDDAATGARAGISP
jgi:DNA-binding CsgD family transcriptional regulator